jgi:hypothetical protein
MTTNNRIKVSDLDYNLIRENLKTFLRGQDQFTDYDFEGSALSTLIDVLAYNTHYNALYTNLAVNEMFLDSASKRSSVLSIANNYGYTPMSSRTSKAILNVSVVETNATAPIKYIPKNSSFSASIEGVTYSFYTLQDYTAQRNGNTYTFNNVEVFEGTPLYQLYVCTEAAQKFVIPNANIDISTLNITVQETSEKPSYEKYVLAQDIIELTNESLVYFVKELEDSTYEISFGSSGLGKPINIGNIVTVQYLITNKDLANGAKVFTYTGSGLGGTLTAIPTGSSFGGKDSESVEEIRYNVSQSFFDQNRAVTPGDYTALIKRYYSNLDSINVWGGEYNDPVQYGKVYISIKPTNGPYLTPPEKAYIANTILKSKNVVSITPVLVDPAYLNLHVETNVYYDKNKTTRSIDEIKTAVYNNIAKYTQDNLRKYDGIFRMSKFSSAIDNTDQSILSNITTFKIHVEVEPKYDIAAQYKLNLVNPIYNELVPEESFVTTGFYIDNSDTVYYMDDDGISNIRLYSVVQESGEKLVKNPSIGTIDYDKGLVVINGLKITNLVDANFNFIIKTQSYDVISIRNQIVDIPLDKLTINVIQDNSSNLNLFNGTSYQFSSSRS